MRNVTEGKAEEWLDYSPHRVGVVLRTAYWEESRPFGSTVAMEPMSEEAEPEYLLDGDIVPEEKLTDLLGERIRETLKRLETKARRNQKPLEPDYDPE